MTLACLTPAAASRSRRNRTLRTPGAIWYSTTVALPKGSGISWSASASVGRHNELACAFLPTGWGSSVGDLGPERGTARPYMLIDTPVLEQREGEGRPPHRYSGGGIGCGGMMWTDATLSSDMVLSFVFAIASDGRVRSSDFEFQVDPDARILAESWGRDAGRWYDEEDFAGPRLATRPDAAEAEVGVAAGRTLAVKYRRSATMAFNPGASIWQRDAYAWWGSEVPNKVISVEGPAGPPTYADQGDFTPQVGGRAYAFDNAGFAGLPPGRYRLTVEGLAGAKGPDLDLSVTGSAPRRVSLFALDADVPACSTTRVLWRDGGSRVCGVSAAKSRAMLSPR